MANWGMGNLGMRVWNARYSYASSACTDAPNQANQAKQSQPVSALSRCATNLWSLSLPVAAGLCPSPCASPFGCCRVAGLPFRQLSPL